MAAKAKYSKKMFENLDRAEVRKLAIVGMKLAPAKAYTMDFKTLVSWVHDRATEVPSDEVNGDRDRDPRPFVEVDLNAVGNEAFRDGVMFYISELQEFVRGNIDEAPNWPPEGEIVSDDESVEETPIETKSVPTKKKLAKKQVAEKVEDAPKRKRGRPRKTEATAASPVVIKAAPEATPTPKIKIKKARLSTAKSAPVETTSTPTATFDVAAMVKSIEDLTERVAELNITVSNISAYTDGLAEGIKDGFSTVNSQVTAVRAEQTAAGNLLGNALLFLLNSVVFEEGEEKIDLSGIPEPNSYLDLD